MKIQQFKMYIECWKAKYNSEGSGVNPEGFVSLASLSSVSLLMVFLNFWAVFLWTIISAYAGLSLTSERFLSAKRKYLLFVQIFLPAAFAVPIVIFELKEFVYYVWLCVWVVNVKLEDFLYPTEQ